MTTFESVMMWVGGVLAMGAISWFTISTLYSLRTMIVDFVSNGITVVLWNRFIQHQWRLMEETKEVMHDSTFESISSFLKATHVKRGVFKVVRFIELSSQIREEFEYDKEVKSTTPQSR